MENFKIGFIGAGGIARAHAFSLSSLKYYYDDPPGVKLVSVTSSRKESRSNFAKKYDFDISQSIEEFANNDTLDAVLILGPNKVHFEHFQMALKMPGVKHIYIEKPVCASKKEEEGVKFLLENIGSDINIQVGFQFLLTAAVREALAFWKSGILGNPIHFDLKYYHGDYLQKSYRDKRQTRLTSAPDGGAMADLGSHGISMLMAFFGENLNIVNALQSGSYNDVPFDSDLFSSISLFDANTKAVGNMSASRVSSGTGDMVNLEIFAEQGALRFSSHSVDYFEYYLEKTRQWVKQPVGSHYKPITSFPSGHVPPGWLRSMIHAHYVFLSGNDKDAFVPNLAHGLAVQRIVRETASHLTAFRDKTDAEGV